MKAATIQVIKMILLSNLFFSFQLSAMQEIAIPSDNLFEQLPSNVTYTILTHGHYPYPWKNVTHACGLKAVCKKWNEILTNTNQVIKTLNIPEMHLAVMKDDIEEIIDLKLKGHSILEPDYCGFNPSHYAIAYSKENAIKILRVGHCLTYFKEEHSEYWTKNETIQELLDNLCDDAYDHLFYPCTKENLIKTAQDDNFTQAINILLTKPTLAYELFEETDIAPTSKTNKLVLYALQNALENALNYHATVKGSDTNQYIKNYFTNELIDGFFESFIRNGANPNAHNEYGITPLMGLCLIEKKDYYPVLIKLLALPTIDVNLLGKVSSKASEVAPLHLAALSGYFEAFVALLNNNRSSTKCDINCINKFGFSPLYYSVQDGHYEYVKALIENGADASIIVKNNRNLLHIAASKGYAKILDILIPLLKKNINHKDCDGRTPLVYCVASKSENANLCVRLLTNADADPNITTNDGRVALYYTPHNDLLEIAKVLLEKGARVNTRISNKTPINGVHYDGYTPLHCAAKNGRCNFIKLFLEYGADKTLKTATGETALDLAREYRNIELAKDNVPSIEEHEEKLAQYEEAIQLLS